MKFQHFAQLLLLGNKPLPSQEEFRRIAATTSIHASHGLKGPETNRCPDKHVGTVQKPVQNRARLRPGYLKPRSSYYSLQLFRVYVLNNMSRTVTLERKWEYKW